MDYLNNIVGVIGWIALGAAIVLYIKARKAKIENQIRERELEERNPKVVVIGGGTGQSVFLRGLKYYTNNITAVVTVADDGGGSGVLREDLGMLPPGDIRNCLLALANIEPTMNEVMQYRFEEGGLKGQSFGNLFLAAMTGLYGNFETAVSKLGEIFAITGKVYPVTLEDVNLVAELENGKVIEGESAIPMVCKSDKTNIKRLRLDHPNIKPLKEVIYAINNADIIVMGPGSLYTSVIPNLLVDGVVDAIKNSDAPKVYVGNVMTQPGETEKYNLFDHANAIIEHAGENILDYVIANKEILQEDVFMRYNKDGAEQVLLDNHQKKSFDKLGIKVIEADLIEIKNNYIRHDAKGVSKVIMQIVSEERNM